MTDELAIRWRWGIKCEQYPHLGSEEHAILSGVPIDRVTWETWGEAEYNAVLMSAQHRAMGIEAVFEPVHIAIPVTTTDEQKKTRIKRKPKAD
jgi:hypothetical protein